MGRIMHLNRIPQSHYVQRAPSPSPPQPFDLRSLAQGVIPSESVKKSGVRMSQPDINLRPYPSSDGSCELFYAPYARWSVVADTGPPTFWRSPSTSRALRAGPPSCRTGLLVEHAM